MNLDLSPRALRRLFSLRRDMAEPGVIDAAIRDGVQLGGTNLWVLMFAIVIASVGLNVNSTAVIIGAMLISPLMGPIIGAGYGAGIQDSALIRLALRNLTIFGGISLATSTLYFAVSPLSQAQSELLARTSPTIWDVLIAFLGGAAGRHAPGCHTAIGGTIAWHRAPSHDEDPDRPAGLRGRGGAGRAEAPATASTRTAARRTATAGWAG